MAKTFRPWQVDQVWLLPPSVRELVPERSPAHFIRELVREELDLAAILDTHEEERGFPPYHPVMVTALLLCAYTQGVYSSRKMARGCEERVDFMAVTAMQRPDFRTLSDFRKRRLAALGGLFGQVLKLCQKAGMVALGHVALDGTKLKANASKRRAMSHEELSADTGFLSEHNLKELRRRRIRGYVATGRQKHGEPAATRLGSVPGTATYAMRKKLERAGFRSRYRLRKQIVEPTFGQIKEARGFRRFLLRGLAKVPHEWALILVKLARAA